MFWWPIETFFSTAISFRTCGEKRKRRLVSVERRHWLGTCGTLSTYHVFSAGHEPLVDDLGRIVSACVDVYALLDGRVGACS